MVCKCLDLRSSDKYVKCKELPPEFGNDGRLRLDWG